MEQCGGWASQGECTRNPRFMMTTCPLSCKEMRAKVFDGALDTRADCMDRTAPASACSSAKVREDCPGSCLGHQLCLGEADAEECMKALRCRELKDESSGCPAKVNNTGCQSEYAGSNLKRCYLSCARYDLAGLLRRYRAKITSRTRKYGVLDEDRAGRAAGAPLLPWPCWKGNAFDERAASTCGNPAAELIHRWQIAAGGPLCRWRGQATTPRPPPMRKLEVPADHAGAISEESLQRGHHLHVEPIALAPKVRLVRDFITAEEAAHVIEVGMPHMHRSLAGGRTESIRTSSTGMLPANDPVVRRITERAAYLTGYPYHNVEPLQLLKYIKGQKYEPHFDYGEACDFEENLYNGHRHVTMLVYLNTVPLSHGGHTSFPKLNLEVQPEAHSAIVFNDCHPNGQEDPRTLHGGTPPSNGTKIAINIWIRAGSWNPKPRL